MALGENLTPVTDDDVNGLLAAMREKALATDQRILVSEFLSGRSLTCQQAGSLLEEVKLGLMQRMVAFEVLHGRLTDLPDGLPHVLEPLSGPIRRDIEVCLQNPASTGRRRSGLFSSRAGSHWSSEKKLYEPLELGNGNTFQSSFKPLKLDEYRPAVSSTSRERRCEDLSECVDRLRSHVMDGQVPEPVYRDLKTVFDSLGLGPLPAPSILDTNISMMLPMRNVAEPHPPTSTPPKVDLTRTCVQKILVRPQSAMSNGNASTISAESV